MADIRLRIEVNPNAETETLGNITNKVNDVGSNANLSNASFKANSDGIYINTSNPKESGREMLSWGENSILKFNNDDYLSNNGVDIGYLASETEPDEFVWGIVPSTKKYSVKLTFSNANALKDIVIYGDPASKQFPTKAIIDGTKTISSDDYQWAINMETESDTHTIEFTDWNRGNYNACLTKIMVMLRYFDIDKGWIDSIESLSQSTSDPSSIQYGFIANSGSANIRDINGEIQDYVQDGIIQPSNATMQLYLNNGLIRTHITTDSDYLINDKMLVLQMSNITEKLDNIYDGLQLTESMTAYQILKDIMTSLGFKDAEYDEMLTSMAIVDNAPVSIKTYLNSVVVQYPFLEPSTFRDAIDKVCTLTQLNMFLDKNRFPKFVSSRPICSSDEITNAIKINKYNIFGDGLNTSLFKKNKINTFGYIDKNESLQSVNQNQLLMSIYSIDMNKNTTFLWNSLSEANNNNSGYEILEYTITTQTGNPSIKILHGKIKYTPQERLVNMLNNKFHSELTASSYYSILKSDKTELNLPWTSLYATLFGGIEVEATNIEYTNGSYIIPFTITTDYTLDNVHSIFLSLNQTLWKYSIVFSDVTINQNADFLLPTNEIIRESVKYNNKNMITEIIKPQILSDYENGVDIASIDIFCGEYKSATGELLISKSELIDVGDIIFIVNDLYPNGKQRYWKVTGAEFSYKGSPIQHLELQEIVKII